MLKRKFQNVPIFLLVFIVLDDVTKKFAKHLYTKKYFLKDIKGLTTDFNYFWVAEFKNDIRFALSHEVFEIWVIPIFIFF